MEVQKELILQRPPTDNSMPLMGGTEAISIYKDKKYC